MHFKLNNLEVLPFMSKKYAWVLSVIQEQANAQHTTGLALNF